MKRNKMLLLVAFMVLSLFSFGAAKKTVVRKPASEVILNVHAIGDEKGLGIDVMYPTKKGIYYGYGAYGSYWDDSAYYYDHKYYGLGVHGIAGSYFPDTNVKMYAKLGLTYHSWTAEYKDSFYKDLDYTDSRIEIEGGVGLGFPLNNKWDLFIEGHSDRSLVIGLGFK